VEGLLSATLDSFLMFENIVVGATIGVWVGRPRNITIGAILGALIVETLLLAMNPGFAWGSTLFLHMVAQSVYIALAFYALRWWQTRDARKAADNDDW